MLSYICASPYYKLHKRASFIFALHLAEKWQRHPAADLRGYKPLLQFTIFSSNKSVNYFYLKIKDVHKKILRIIPVTSLYLNLSAFICMSCR